MSKYFLFPYRRGILEIRYLKNKPGCHCRFSFNSGEVFVPRCRMGRGQQLLPFPETMELENFILKAEATATRALPSILKISIHKKGVLDFCLRGETAAIELLEDCPALALLLAERINNDPSVASRDQVAALASRKRVEILRYCSYPARPWVARLMKKIPAIHCSPYLLRDLAGILRQGASWKLDILRHLPQISRLVVFLLKNEEIASLVKWNFYLGAATYPETDVSVEAEYLLGEIARIAGDPELSIPVPKIESVRELPEIHDQVAERYLKLHNFLKDDTVFRRPPVPELEQHVDTSRAGIIALTCARDLFFEGERMHHCIASYSRRIAVDENVYAYHVSSPNGEEATIMIVREEITWRLLEIRGVSNADVAATTIEFVENWLNRHNKNLLDLHGRSNQAG